MSPLSADRRVLVIGGGAAGNAVTILLRRAGIPVDLVEARQDWNATAGSGITLQGNALRVLRELGVWEQVEASGYGFGSVGITAPDGTVLHAQDDLRTGGDDLPATVGMQRPRLQQILIEAVRASGATVRLGTTADILDQDDDGVSVRLSDGSEHRYDLVIAADGLGSA
ncbi:FAD-dependent monooxygenase, partial [Streptomyces sp. NPDC003832]